MINKFYGYAVLMALVGGCAPSKPASLRVMTYNIHHGIGMDGKLDINRAAAVIEAAHPDLVALQEVDRATNRSHKVDELQVLADRTGMQPIFGKTIDHDGGEYGIAVLSRLPVIDHQTHLLPNQVEDRALLEVRVRVGEHPIVFFNTDLDDSSDETIRMGSIRKFLELAKQHTEPVLFVGDFFVTPEHPVLKPVYVYMRDTCPATGGPYLTFTATTPTKRIDYIFSTGYPRMRCTEYQILPEPIAAAHRPVLAVFSVGG